MPIWWIPIPCSWIVSPNLGFVNHQNTPNWSKPNSTRIIPHDHNFQTRCCCCYCFGVVGHVVHAFQVALFRQISIPGFPDCFPQGRFLWITRNTPNWSNPNSTQFNPRMAIISNLRVVVLLGAMWHRPIWQTFCHYYHLHIVTIPKTRGQGWGVLYELYTRKQMYVRFLSSSFTIRFPGGEVWLGLVCGWLIKDVFMMGFAKSCFLWVEIIMHGSGFWLLKVWSLLIMCIAKWHF
jgi:hypothetical protein